MKKKLSKKQWISILVSGAIALAALLCIIFMGGKDEQNQPTVSGGDAIAQEEAMLKEYLTENGDIIMPDVLGKVLDDAAALLHKINVLYELEWELDENAEPQAILGQSIAAGEKITPFTKVILTVNSLVPEIEETEEESDEREVPDVTGMDVNQAMEQLFDRDLQLGYVRSDDEGNIEEENLADVEVGQVCGQVPQGGTIVPKYEKVTLIIKTGTPENQE